METTACIVNYGTPEMTRRAVWSLRSLYPHLPISVLDNASPDDSVERLRAVAPCARFDLVEAGENLHHGPGLDRLIRQATTPWVLLFDSDCLAYRSGFLEDMLVAAEHEGAYMVGQRLDVDAYGYPPSEDGQPIYRYVHPHCAIVRRSTYLKLPPFEKHGAPCLTNERVAVARGEDLVDFPVRDYVFHLSRGTVEQHGYRLGPQGWLYQLRHHLRRLLLR